MALIEHRATLRAGQAEAFAASQDYARRHDWDPFAARLERSADGVVTVTAWHGLRMQVEYVAWKPPERAAIRMLDGPRCLAAFAGTWAFLPRGDGLVEARFRYRIEAARGWCWLEPAMAAYFGWETRRRLAALQRYLERPRSPDPA